jgi:hypothetical protein
VFLIAIAVLGLAVFGVGWAVLGHGAGALLAKFASFGTEFDRFLTGLVILGPALGAACMLAAIWLALRASGRFPRRRERLRAAAAVVTIILGAGAAAVAANAARMALDDARYNRSYTHLAFELRLPAGTSVPEDKSAIRMVLSTPVLESPALFGARWASEEWLRRDGDRPVIMGLAPLRAKTTDRRLVLGLPGEPERIFRIDLPATPPFGLEASAWMPVAQISENGVVRPGQAEDQAEIRYRID